MRNHEIKGFVEFLMLEELTGKFSRMRTRFAKIALAQLEQIDQERMILIQQFSFLQEDGKPKVDPNTNEFMLRDKEKFADEYFELMSELFIIEEWEERKEMLEAVNHIVLNTTRTFKGEEALKYDRWCDIVENIEE